MEDDNRPRRQELQYRFTIYRRCVIRMHFVVLKNGASLPGGYNPLVKTTEGCGARLRTYNVVELTSIRCKHYQLAQRGPSICLPHYNSVHKEVSSYFSSIWHSWGAGSC